MENSETESRIQGLKAAATSQTEFVNGLLIHLLIHIQTLDEIIEENGTDELKDNVEPLRSIIPDLIVRISDEVGKIHENNNELS